MKYFMIFVLCLVSLVAADNRPSYRTNYNHPSPNNHRTMVVGPSLSTGSDGSTHAHPGYIITDQNTLVIGSSLSTGSDGGSHAHPGSISTNRQSYNN